MASPSSSSLLFLLLFLRLLLSASSSTSSSRSSSSDNSGSGGSVDHGDLQLLLSFKGSLPDPDHALPTWQPRGDPCTSFSGVSCRASRVAAVRLQDLPLDAQFSAVSSSLLSLEYLETLSLRGTNLTGELVPAGGSRCGGRLVELDLAGNGLRGSVAGIPVLAASCPSLRSLNLSRNSLGFAPGAGDGDGAGGVQLGLDVLDLSFNRLTGGGALAWLLLSVAGLRELYLADSGVGGVIPAPANCSALQRLDLTSNALSGVAPAAFAACEGLAYLNLSSNKLGGELPAGFLGACRSLVDADISSNNLSGALPADFSRCPLLESINLSSNNLSGELPAEALAPMGGLKRLVLSFNKFSGVLPDVLPELPGLELLDLSSNALEGPIPPGLCRGGAGRGSSLRELYLQNNLFTGGIPPSISNCSMLVSIDLSFNYIKGVLPASMGYLSRLRDLIMWQNLLEGEIPGELGRLQALENLILDDNGFTGTIPAGLSNCTSLNWVSLSSNRLGGPIPPWIGRFSSLAILKLGNNSFSGPIPPELGDCRSLIWLDLNSNRLSGTIPPALAKQSGSIAVGLVAGKRFVYMKNDGSSECHGAGNLLEFAGIRQEQLSRVPTRRSCNFTRVYMGSTQYTFNNNGSALFLDLSYNQLEGAIPEDLGAMYYLMVLNLGHNALSGVIPPQLGRLKNIGILDLSHNALEGPIPATFSALSMLAEIDLSNNRLNGSIPVVGQLATFPAARYMNNSGLCGFPLPPCGAENATAADAARRQRSHRRQQASVAGSIAMGLLLSLFCILVLLVLAVESRKRRRKRNELGGGGRDGYNVDSRTHSGSGGTAPATAWKLTLTKEALSTNLATFEPKAPLQKLTLGDLLEATNGFHSGCLIGSGGFGDVYKAQLKDGSVVAIKKLIHISGQGDREFTAEMETIGKVKHRNLVPLLGYCKVGEERLLVYEFMKYGSLEDVLHDRKRVGVRLNWATRRKIAVGAARGLAFLHHNCTPHIIHRDMKSSNVLLDGNLEARVSDFGMARMMSSAMDTHLSVSTLAGTPGYVPPEYYQSFRCSTKGDVYSYGVVLLELLTGRRPTDSADFGDNNNLVGWVKQHSRLRVADVFDPALLREDPSLELELLEHLKVACACLDDRPTRRPTMLNVMAMFKEIQAGSTVGSAASAPSVDVVPTYGVMGISLQEIGEEKD